MRVYGVDFTSAPSRRKPICVAVCRLDGGRLTFERLERIRTLAAFEASLAVPGPWVAGFDFPFTQSRTFLDNIGWVEPWTAFADRIAAMSRAQWRTTLEDYKRKRDPGDREHSRAFEKGTGAASPQKLYGVPVAVMQHAGVPPLRRTRVHLPGLADGDLMRVAVEAYPGVAARALIGRTSYKNEAGVTQDPKLRDARHGLLEALTGEPGRARFGLRVGAPAWLASDPSGDPLDALLGAAQAAWFARLGPGALDGLDTSEGWIADPDVLRRMPRRA